MAMKIKNVHIFGGGTFSDITNHFAVAAPAFGWTANKLYALIVNQFKECNIVRDYTVMAGGRMRTNEDVATRIEELKSDANTKVIFFNVAMCDWEPVKLHQVDTSNYDKNSQLFQFSKGGRRLETREGDEVKITFRPANKVINTIRKGRKDIFLVGFKATCGATKQEMFEKGLRLCKESSVNLVMVNDTNTHWNMIVTPEEAIYHETDNRQEALQGLVDMAYLRSSNSRSMLHCLMMDDM